MDEINQEKTIYETTSEPKWRVHFWPVVIAILLTTILLASVGYYWQTQSNKKQQALEDYIKFLQNTNH